MPGAGELDRRIQIQRLTAGVVNDYNEPADEWVDYIKVWARREDVSDKERFSAEQINATQMSRFVVRSSSESRAINASYRISYDNSIWDIVGVKETRDGRNRFIEITAARESD